MSLELKLARLAAALTLATEGFGPETAGACDSTACALASRYADDPLPAGRWRLDLSVRRVEQDRALWGGQRVDDVWRRRVDLAVGALERTVHQERAAAATVLLVSLSRGIGRHLSAQATVPLFRRQTVEFLHPTAGTNAVAGIGDLQLGLQGVVRSGGRMELATGFVLKLPTGPSALAGVDRVADPMLQPGTGSADAAASVQLVHRLPFVTLTASASFQKTTRNARGYRHGDESVVALAAARRLVPRLTGTLQLKAQHAGRHRFAGEPVLATGFTLLHAVAGLRLRLAGDTAVYGNAQTLAYAHVNEAQLAPRFTVTVGVVKAF